MSELNLPTCPICHARNSLSLKTLDRGEQSFLWYECRECGSVLLWVGGGRWAYQKVGRENKTHLLKQPMTAAELEALVEVPVQPSVAPAPVVSAVPTKAQDAPAEPTAPAPAPVPEAPTGGVTLANFTKVQTGMTYAEVCEIFGCPGELMMLTEILGTTSETYSWDASSGKCWPWAWPLPWGCF